ncbi:tripartite tricarboxylate transporter substrate binding protein [Bradyrhizobium sp. 147]|uniref:Bug family tripartite tricarboxylate transporter substrate binding protein n=1 Tax=Bradyrhizobium sp. 147 TaxID=2782623 RepID=UPI001FF8F4F7|nr:tripartite tricarboxylate transporter substrate binding protein [Bradyrhizobium sp. 147]MCK1683359.1 tripartite tricarboxylate transporter substrate binding protein [Bradyrhizobium sp. 147]
MSETPHFRLPRRTFLLGALAASLSAHQVAAQPYPSNLIRIVVPTSAGTPPDIISRLVADGLAANEGWRLVVEDRPGALQTIAMNDVSGRPADGYTLLTMSLPMMVTPTLLPKAETRPDADFDPVVKISTSYTVLVTTPSLSVNSLPELVALLKSKPGKLNFASAGFGTPSHLIGEMFALQAGVHATHVPYQQFSQAIADLIGGNVEYMFVTTLPVIDLIETGKLRALAVTAPARIAALKNVPSVAEAGFPDLVTADWIGFAARRGTPAEITLQLNKAINKVLAEPKIRASLDKIGAVPVGGTAAEFGDGIRSDLAHWAKIVKDADIKLP